MSPRGSPHNHHAKLNKVWEKKGLKHGISEEEMKIRGEIEREIEIDLEEEIKGGIYQQALRLRRLYQHRKKPADLFKPPEKELLEVNISIKMEGGTRMEVKETRKEAPSPRSTSRSRSDTAARTIPEVKRLDWVKSLRSRAPPSPPVLGKSVGFYRTKMPVGVWAHHPNYSFKRS